MLIAQIFDIVFMLLESGVVHEDIELAEGADRFVDCLGAKSRLADIARQQQATPSLVFDGSLRGFRIRMLVEICDGDIGAFAREKNGDRPPDPRVSAGNERHHVLELFRPLIGRRREERRIGKVLLKPRFFQMLRWKFLWITTLAGLHRLFGGFGPTSLAVALIDLGLDTAPHNRGFFGIGAASGTTSGHVHTSYD